MFFRGFFVILTCVLFLCRCSPYQKVLKSNDVKAKITLAQELYDQKKYAKASVIFETFVNSYYGKAQGERLTYMAAMCYYYTKDYYLSAHRFNKFCESYPSSEKFSEILFLEGKSRYMLSPKYSVDQTETIEALNKLQEYINAFPDDQYVPEANVLVAELTQKLEQKDFEIAKQYNTIEDYGSAIKALDIFLITYPGSHYKESALFYRLDSNYWIAYHSVVEKKQERIEQVKNLCASFSKAYPNTKFASKLKAITKSLKTIN